MTWVAEQEAPACEPAAAPDELSFRFFYDKSPLLMGTVALCPDGDILHVYDNLASSRFLGVEPGTTNGRRARALGVPAEIVELWRAHYVLAAARGESVRFEYPHSAGADERCLSVTVAPLGVEAASGFPLFSYVAEDVTERRRIEARLRDSEARLQLALDAGRMAVFDWPLSEAEPPLTPELRAQLRIPPDVESTLEDRRKNYHPDDLAVAAATRDRALGGLERFIDFEFRYVWPDGDMRWLQVRSEVIASPGGAPERLVGVQLDITERRRAEEALRDSERRFRVLASAIPALVFETDPIGLNTWVNERMVAYAGLPEPELLGDRWLEIVHPEDRDRAREAWRRAWGGGAGYEEQYRFRRADGVYRWHVVRASPLFLDDGRITAWFGACVDIEDQKATEARLIESELSLNMALEIGQMGTWRRSIGGDYALTVSAEQLSIFGFPSGFTPREEDFRALYEPDDWARLVEARAAFDRTGAPSDTVLPFRRYDTGEPRWVLIRRQVLAWADGRPAEEIGVVIDITERRENEIRLRLMMEELNHRVKNNLATMVSLAAQTAKTCQHIPDFLDRFTGRIQAMSKSNELLTRTSWREVELKDVLATALRPFAAGALSMRGPDGLKVEARVAVGLSLVLHELCTNAIKYGAFAADGGRLEVAWRILDEAHAEIVWTERTVHPVAAPTVPGFGTKLIHRLAAADLGGDADLRFEPAGLVATIRFRRGSETAG